jgi:hypothetical protein
MANIKYLTLEGLTHFKSKIDKTFAAHLTGDRTKEGVNIVLRNNVKTGDVYNVLDSVSIPAVDETYAGIMTPSQLTRLNASATAAFSSIKVGDTTTIKADSVADALNVTAGSGIDISANDTNNTITISHYDTSTVATTPVGPTANQTQDDKVDNLEFTVPQITVDEFGHVTALTGRTIKVVDKKTTEIGHYTPSGTNGELPKSAGNNVTAFGNTITFVQSVTVDSKKHLTGATFGSLKLTETTLSKGTEGSGNGISDINVNGHQITLTKTTFATPDDVTGAINAAKEYADSLELRKFDFKGDLPSTDTAAVVGDVYRIATAGTYFGATFEVGDFVLCVTPGTTANAACWASLNTNWSVDNYNATLTASSAQTIAKVGGVDIKVNVPDFSLNGHGHDDLATAEHEHTLNHNVGDDDVVNLSISSTTSKLGKNAAGFTITASHKAYTAKTIVPTGSLEWGETIQIPSVVSDAYGHVNGGELVSFTMPDNPNTDTKVTSVDNHYKTNGYTGATSGLYKITTDTAGHITSQTAVVKKDIVDLGIPAQDTTYTATDGLSITNTVIKTVRKVEQTVIGSITSAVSASKSNYLTQAPLLLDNNAMYAEIQNITIADIDELF